MALPLILRIPIQDRIDEYVVVEVTTNGSLPLDLKLVATEGEAPYIFTSVQK